MALRHQRELVFTKPRVRGRVGEGGREAAGRNERRDPPSPVASATSDPCVSSRRNLLKACWRMCYLLKDVAGILGHKGLLEQAVEVEQALEEAESVAFVPTTLRREDEFEDEPPAFEALDEEDEHGEIP